MVRGAALRGLRARIHAAKTQPGWAGGGFSSSCLALLSCCFAVFIRANPRTQSAYEIRGPFFPAALSRKRGRQPALACGFAVARLPKGWPRQPRRREGPCRRVRRVKELG